MAYMYVGVPDDDVHLLPVVPHSVMGGDDDSADLHPLMQTHLVPHQRANKRADLLVCATNNDPTLTWQSHIMMLCVTRIS